VKRDASSTQFRFLDQHDIGAEPKEGSPKKKMGINPQKSLAQSYEASNVQDRVWCELVKLHTVNKKEVHEEIRGQEEKDRAKDRQRTSPENHPWAWGSAQCWGR
jgi:hypothetical protein